MSGIIHIGSFEALVHKPGRSINHSFGGPNPYRHFRQLLLNGSETGDRFAERDPLLRIQDGIVQRGLCSTHSARTQFGATDIENIECNVMTLADFPNDVIDGDHCIFENECACRGAFQSHLSFFSAGRYSGILFFDNEATELLSIDLREGNEHVGKRGIRYPHLFAVDDPMRSVSAANRIRFRGQRVGAASGFRECICRNLFSLTQQR